MLEEKLMTASPGECLLTACFPKAVRFHTPTVFLSTHIYSCSFGCTLGLCMGWRTHGASLRRAGQGPSARPCLRAPAEEQGGRKVARAATALGIRHLLEDGSRTGVISQGSRPGWLISLGAHLGLAQGGPWWTRA